MISAKLLEILNEIQRPNDILTKLREANFAVTDLTEDGDSVLHVLAKSNRAKASDFSEYLDVLMSAGANANAFDKQGISFLSYYLEHANSYYFYRTFSLLLESNNFDVNQKSEKGYTFFEYIYDANSYDVKRLYPTLLKHTKFDINQKTSKHNSILLHMLSEKLGDNHQVDDMAKNIKTNPNIQNNNGQTALSLILSNMRYKDVALIKALVNHPQSDINILDKDGNNYLQLAIIHCQYQADEIAKLFIKKDIDVAHKNNDGKSVFDLILENKVNRSDYANNIVLTKTLKHHPSSLLASYADGKTILGELLRSQDYTITSQFSTLFKLYKSQSKGSEFFKKRMSECFDDFHQNLIPSETIRSLTQAIFDANLDIDVEYYLALIVICPSFSLKREIIENLKKLKPDFDLSTVLRHIKSLTKENSAERLQGLNSICKLGLPLDCFDETVLAWEEQHLRTRKKNSLVTDSKMFGHLFSLSGFIPVNNSLSKLTGGLYDDTVPFIVHLMNAYVSHCESSGTHNEHLNAIRHVRNLTVKAMRYYFLSSPWQNYYPTNDNILSSMLADSKSIGVEIITGWAEHAVDLIIKQDDYYRNNGGGCSTDATTEIYNITKLKNLTEAVFSRLYKDKAAEVNKTFIQQDLHKILGLVFTNSSGVNFQTVGNCSLYSLLIALKIKYRLFLPEGIADELYEDNVKFFEQFYLAEYLSRHSKSPSLPHLLMRLIEQKLLAENNLELVAKLISDHFDSDARQEILQIEFMLKRWLLITKSKTTEQFDEQLKALNVILNPNMNSRLQILDRFLNDKVATEDLNELKSWSLEQQTFQGYHLLHIAVLNNNLGLASSLLHIFPKTVDLANWSAEEPLCLVQSVEMLELLVKEGASTARTDYYNALDNAIIANKVDLVLALLKHGAKPSEYSAYFAAKKDPNILHALMDFYPAAITKPTHNHSSAIHAAASSGHSENLRTLVYYGGANPAATDVNGITPLQLALQKGHNETARLLIQYPGTLFNKPYRGDSLVNMTRDIDLKQMIKLKKKERQADLKYFETFKRSDPGIVEENIDYLIIAIRNNDVRAIRGSLLAFPNIKVVDSSNLYCTTPLTQAIQNLAGRKGKDYEDAFEIVEMLLKTPAIDINATMASSEPILFMATSIGDVRVLELFLADSKLDPNRQDNVGYTALHDAVERGHLNCVKRLLQNERVDSMIVNKQNETAADLKGFKFDISECRREVTKHQQSMQPTKIALGC